jgi:hypothetical protein
MTGKVRARNDDYFLVSFDGEKGELLQEFYISDLYFAEKPTIHTKHSLAIQKLNY